MKCWCHYITKRITADLESSPKYFRVIFVPKAFYMKPSLLERKTKLFLKTIEEHYEMIKTLCVKLNMPLQFLYYQKKSLYHLMARQAVVIQHRLWEICQFLQYIHPFLVVGAQHKRREKIQGNNPQSKVFTSIQCMGITWKF